MPGITDLEPFELFRFAGHGALRAIGWLDSSTAFARGSVDRRVFEKLFELLANPWQPFISAGFHDCALCVFTGGPRQIRINNHEVTIGSSNLFVPDNQAVYVAPSSVVHYIDAHNYCPPPAFQQAVLSCPPMRSMDYFRALRRHISLKELQSPQNATISS